MPSIYQQSLRGGAVRYWLYKCNIEGGPAGYWGDWQGMVFNQPGPVQWGGDYSTRSAEVSNYLASEVSENDVIVAYQTNLRAVVGYCTVTKIAGPPGGRELWLQPFEVVHPPFRIHEHKMGTALEQSIAVNGPVMLRELGKAEMSALIQMAGTPQRVMQGRAPAKGWRPSKGPPDAYTE